MRAGATHSWERPRELGFPVVWGRHEVKNADGTTTRYRIQDATPGMYDEILDCFLTDFFPDETMFKSLRVMDLDPKVVHDYFLPRVRACLEQSLSLVVLEEQGEGCEGVAAEPRIAAGIAMKTLTADLPPHTDLSAVPMTSPGRALIQGAGAVRALPGWMPVLPHRFLSDSGMFVRRGSRGRGLAVALLRALPALCAGLGLPAYRSLFTGTGSQKAAELVGFKEFASMPYRDIAREDGSAIYPPELNVNVSIRIMGFDVGGAELKCVH